MRTRPAIIMAAFLLAAISSGTREFHVSVHGDDANDGSETAMLRTISAAALRARPGDVITVHEGVYRERIDPPRGGESDAKRIVYRAAPGEKVVIKGSEVVKGWEREQHDTWKLVLPDSFFGAFNPFRDVIQGDWFNPRGRRHHTGAVYLNGHWLTEAARRDDVMEPAGETALWFSGGNGGYLLNMAWFRPGTGTDDGGRIPAVDYAAQRGVQAASCSEGGECIGWIESGDWVRYEDVDFGDAAVRVEIRAASMTGGGLIELRLDRPDGDLLATCSVSDTGDWQSWASFHADIEPTSGVHTLYFMFREYGQDDETTTIWAQFPGADPNEAEVEVNVRQSVFYPEESGVDYITVRGFVMEHAATPWAPPTAEQIGLIGTHWSKGWIIENNVIRYSTCVGVTLGKHGDRWDNTSQNSAQGYVKTIERGLANGWSEENIGHHIVRGNHISHCEQAGLVGSLGAVFSSIVGNEIHDIHVRGLFTGAEMAGIKIHGAIDTEIRGNLIYRTCRGIWLDWMTQGTRVTRNLLYGNGTREDLFVEVNHGPFMVDHNLFLSPISLFDMSEGGAYAHNLFGGRITLRPETRRETPFHKAHSTEVAGLKNIPGGDDRFYNNLLVHPAGLGSYDNAAQPVWMEGNVFVGGASPSGHEETALVQPEFDPGIEVTEEADGVYLELTLDKAWGSERTRRLVTTELLGRAAIPDLPFERPDGTAYRLDTDYFGKGRNQEDPLPGPFELAGDGRQMLRVWPVAARPDRDPGRHSGGGPWKFYPGGPADAELPRVLLVGDSIMNGYRGRVIGALEGKAGVDCWLTPVHLKSEHLHGDLAEVLAQGPYDVVHFNIGLHGWPPGRIGDGEYEPLLRTYVSIIRQGAPGAKLIWASITPITVAGKPTEPDPVHNVTITRRNGIAQRVMDGAGVEVNDLYGLVVDELSLGQGDRFHWKAPGYALMADQVVGVITSSLRSRRERRR